MQENTEERMPATGEDGGGESMSSITMHLGQMSLGSSSTMGLATFWA